MHVAAVDLGASSGRVSLVDVGPDRLSLNEVRRFANRPREVDGHLRWDIRALYAGVVEGVGAAAAAAPDLMGVGVDSWAIDYALVDAQGRLLAEPVTYRDARTDGVLPAIHAVVPAAELYATTGLQELPFNTLVQLVADQGSPLLDTARHLLLIPDLITFWLTGVIGTERTNASTTQMYDVRSGQWATDLLDRLRIPTQLLPEICEPGSVVGPLRPELRDRLQTPAQLQVVRVGSHDTASAVVGVPMADSARAAYISSGTWSLVGLELDRPVLTEASRRANFTNETGVDGTIRFLRNVMGLWLVQESMRTWADAGLDLDLGELLDQAATLPARQRLVDVDDATLLPPGDQPARIAALCEQGGQPVPASPAEVIRTILDSLALAYRRALRSAAQLADQPVELVHVVGGGANNTLLCQLTADACGLPVLAGPVEAAAIGNALIQARALGAITGDLDALRALTRRTQSIKRYEPQGDSAAWAEAEERLPPR